MWIVGRIFFCGEVCDCRLIYKGAATMMKIALCVAAFWQDTRFALMTYASCFRLALIPRRISLQAQS